MHDVLVTGGAGFIGSHFVRRLLAADDISRVTVLDALTYAGSRENLGDAFLSPKLAFAEGSILDADLVGGLIEGHSAVVHFAAESHVDRSFFEAGNFLATNVLGTHILLDAARAAGVSRFVHVSTDEVYGPLPTGSAGETWPLAPSVPYAASKACADLVALSYWQTHGVPVCVTRSSNNYGPGQHPEKMIPRSVTSLLKGGKITLHGQGEHVRNWLHVEDNCAAIELVLRDGTPGEVYNIAGTTELANRDLAALLLDACGAPPGQVEYVPDRRANDLRYSMTCDRVAALGWQPQQPFAEGLAHTVEWYRDNPGRWAPLLRNGQARLPRISLATVSEAAS
ncbi:MAG: dTDP-glucose 4,6-dehydratase [Streptosporangiaceae bacterium]